MIWFLVISALLNLMLLVVLGIAATYLWRFSNIILLLEDDFSEAIESLESVEASLEKILKMQLFFDSKEVKMVVQESMAELKAGKIAVTRLVQKFVDRSKQKYVVIQEEEIPSPEALAQGGARVAPPSDFDGSSLDRGPNLPLQ